MTVFQVTLYTKFGLQIPFQADTQNIQMIVKEMEKPKWRQSKAYGLMTSEGSNVAINMQDVSAMVFKELYHETDND